MCQYRPGWVRSGSLAALCSRLLILWINADCLGMTWNCGPHKESEGECRPAPFCRREKQTGVHREFLAGIIFLLLSVSFRSPSSSTMHTHTHTFSLCLPSLSVFLLPFSFFIHPLKTTQLYPGLCFPEVKMKQHFCNYSSYLPCWVCAYARVCVHKYIWMYVCSVLWEV